MLRRLVLLAVVAAALTAAPVDARWSPASDTSTPTSEESTSPSTIDTGPTTEMTFPPMVQGVASGNRVYVRTSAVSPTEYLYLRAELVAAGFPDTLEVAPGSFIVDVGTADLATAIRALSAFESVTEVVPAPGYASSITSDEPTSIPWLLALPFPVVAAVFVALRRRPGIDH